MASRGLEFVARGAVAREPAFDDYDVAVEVGFEGVRGAIEDFDDDDCGSRSPLISPTRRKGGVGGGITVGHV